MRPPVRPPRLRCGLFPSIYLPHLLVLPATFGLRCFLPSYPYFPALYVVSVRQVRGLPTASFRFHLTVNTLAVQLCASSLPTRTRDFHPLEPAHGGRTKYRHFAKKQNACMLANVYVKVNAKKFTSPVCLSSQRNSCQDSGRQHQRQNGCGSIALISCPGHVSC